MTAFRTSLALCVAGLLFASSPSAAGDEAAVLKQRAQQLWQARVQDTWADVYDLMPPEEQALAGTDREAFAAYQKEKGPFLYLSAEVGEVVVDGNTGWVRVKFSTRPRLYAIPPTTVEKWDVWLKRDDWRPIPRAVTHEFPTLPPGERNAKEDAVLAARVDELWKVLESQDWRRFYDYLDPDYRANTTMDVHLARPAKFLYLSHKIVWVETTGDTGVAKVAFTQKLNDPTLTKLDPDEQTAVEEWVRVDGQWFRNTKPRKDNR